MSDSLNTVSHKGLAGSSSAGRSATGWILGILVALAIAVYGYVPPADHVENVGWNAWKPAAGYAWRDAKSPRIGVAWQPGLAHPGIAHVLAAAQEQRWAPEAGYAWRGLTPAEGVRWEPGQGHPAYSHVVAAKVEGYWQPEPGYAFSAPGKLSHGRWQLGSEHPDYQNVVAAATEGYWSPRPGYRLETPGKLSNAIWTPGSKHPDFPNILAAEQANQWKPETGYAWINQDPADMRVAVIQRSDSGETEVNTSQQPDRVALFFKGLFKAIIGGSAAQAERDDGIIARNVGRPLAGAIRDDGLRDMARAFSGQ